jgi:hypothetical protein
VGRWTGGGEGSCRCGVGVERGNHGAGERERRGVRWGSGSAADAWRKRGHEQGGPWQPADGAQPAGLKTGGRGRRVRWARGRPNIEGGERMTDGPWAQCRAVALTDRWSPAGGGRGREESEAWGARVPARERRWAEPR